jgi:hypothetical protein
MDVHFEVVYVPLRPEDEVAWREAIRMIAEMILDEWYGSLAEKIKEAKYEQESA